jgi:L-amino acid N-acyltransferase YncA/regulator of sirC expression with transglutaminase-like and TPR domain
MTTMTTEDWLLAKPLRVLLFDELDEYHSAIATLDEHLASHPHDGVAYNNRGLAHSEMGEHELAFRDFAEAIKHAPNDPVPYMNRGDLYLRQKPQPMFREAIADFDQAISLNANDPTFHRRRAHACLAAGRSHEALNSLDRAITLDPEFKQSYVERAELHAKLGDTSSASRDMQMAQQPNAAATQAAASVVSSGIMSPSHASTRSAVTIENMVPEDWPDVSSIFLEGIATGVATFETLPPNWETWDREHLPFCRLVARHGGQIAGWAALSRRSRRSAYAGVAELSIYVAAWARAKGVGSALIEAAIKESERFGVWTLQGSIMADNIASLKLVEAAGFRQVGVREKIGKQGGKWRDTILVERRSKTIGVD